MIEVRGDTVILATNQSRRSARYVTMSPSLLPQGSQALRSKPSSAAARGLRKSKRSRRQIIAADTSEEFSTDLAILVVKGVKNPPTPISVFAKSDTTEGMAYTGAGFPLGGMLGKVNDNKGNPSVTITRAGIAALRRDEHGHVDLFQVDGSLQPATAAARLSRRRPAS